MSYYDSTNSALKFARQSAGGVVDRRTTVIAQGVQGLYTSLFYDAGNRPNIFFFKKTNVTAYRAARSGGTWKFTYLGTGGREAQTARKTERRDRGDEPRRRRVARGGAAGVSGSARGAKSRMVIAATPVALGERGGGDDFRVVRGPPRAAGGF